MFGKKKTTTRNRWIVFDIEDNLPENVQGFDLKKDAKKHFEARLINRGLSVKDVSQALRSELYLTAESSVHIVDLE